MTSAAGGGKTAQNGKAEQKKETKNNEKVHTKRTKKPCIAGSS